MGGWGTELGELDCQSRSILGIRWAEVWVGDTEVHGAFGLLHRPDEGILLKTDDRIELASKLGYRFEKKGSLTALGSFRTQMAPGFATVDGVPDPTQVTSRFMAPGYLVLALGLDIKPLTGATFFFGAVHVEIHVQCWTTHCLPQAPLGWPLDKRPVTKWAVTSA